MNKQKQRPGVLLYFDTLSPALARLTDEQCGMLLRGIVEYAQTGAIQELDGMTGLAFDLLRPGVDRDAERYAEEVEQRRFAVYCREARKHGVEPKSYEEWQRAISSDIGRYPSTTPITASAPDTTPTAFQSSFQKPSSFSGAGGIGEQEGCKGEERENPQTLFDRFLEAIDTGEQDRACSLANRLYSLGYDADKATRRLTRRA